MRQRRSRSILNRLLVGVLTLVLSLAGSVSYAVAAWTPPENLAAAGDQLSSVQVGYDGAGRGYLTYARWLGGANWQIVMRERPAGGGSWGPITPLVLTPAPGGSFDTAVSGAGDVVLAYNSGGQIQVTRRPAGGAWTPSVGYSSPGTNGPGTGYPGGAPSVDIGDDGTALVAWTAFNSCCGNVTPWRALGAAYRPGIGWDATPQVWNSSTSDVHSNPAATVDDDGNGIVAYGARTGFNQDELFTVDLTGGAWGAPVLRSSAGFGSNNYLDADSRGTTSAIVWSRGLNINVISRTGGTWSAASTLSGNQNGDAPVVAVGGPGTVYAAYSEQGGNAGVFLATRPAGGSFSIQRLSAGFARSVAANAAGDVAVAWDQYIDPGRYAFMMLKPAGGAFPAAPTQLTTTFGTNGSGTRPVLAVDVWGHALAATVPSANGFGSAIITSIESRDAAAEPTTTRPSISPATARVGDALTCSTGVFGGTAPFSYTYAWLNNGVPIAGATTSAYTAQAGNVGGAISCTVVATNDAGSAQATSDERFIEYTAPQNLTVPTLSGTAQAGQTLTCNQGTWSGHSAPELTNEWMRNGTAIAGEQASTYDVQLSDQGTTIACRVTATNEGGRDVSASSAVTIPAVVNPTNTVAPTIAGVARVAIGSPLTCGPGTWTGQPTPSLTPFWLRDGSIIAYANPYVVAAADAGSTLTCAVSGENVGGEVTVAATNNRVADPAPINTSLPIVNRATGSTWAVGGTANCARGAWSFAQTYTDYNWFRNGVLVAAGQSTYLLTQSDAGTAITCMVTANGRMGSTQATSAPKLLAAAPVASVSPSVTGTTRPGRTLTCARGTWSDATSYAFSWQVGGLPVGGTTNKYIVRSVDVGGIVTCAVRASGPGGITTAFAPGRLITA